MEAFILFIYIFILMVLRIQSRTSHMVDKSSTTDLQAQPQIIGFSIEGLILIVFVS